MPNTVRKPDGTMRHRMVAAAWLGIAILLASCQRPKPPPATRNEPDPQDLSRNLAGELAGARVDLARQALASHDPGGALALLVAAVEADPSNWEALRLAGTVLGGTRWFLPEAEFAQGPLTIHHLALGGSGELWAALSLQTKAATKQPSPHTVVRWNAEAPRMEAVLFPVPADETGFMMVSPGGRYLLTQRGSPGNDPPALLCDATTLKPIRELGHWPSFPVPGSLVAFSADALLLAHPAHASPADRAVVWHLRDSKTGEILRTSTRFPPEGPPPLTAHLDRNRLRVVHADGSIFEMPVFPTKSESRRSLNASAPFRQACFSEDGEALDALIDPGPGRKPETIRISMTPGDTTRLQAPWVAPWLSRFPWSLHPSVWNRLPDLANPPEIIITQNRACFPSLRFAIHEAAAEVTAVAMNGDHIAIGDSNGTIAIQQILPLPIEKAGVAASLPRRLSPAEIRAFASLAESLAGVRHDTITRSLCALDAEHRIQAAQACDFEALARVFPTLESAVIREQIGGLRPRRAEPEAMVPLWQRLAAMDATGASWAELLELDSPMSSTRWHGDLKTAVQAIHSGSTRDPGVSPWLAPVGVARVFEKGDGKEILETIRTAGGQGPAAAKALELSLASERPEWIAACLESAKTLPPFLKQLALSRIAWLEDRRADALGMWPDEFPDMENTRLYQDWEGWEQADFRPAYQELHRCMSTLLETLELPADASEEQRREIAERFQDPENLKAVGRTRFAKACMKAAFAFSKHKEEKETTFRLASMARNLGEAPEPCLRAEAMALTAMGDYQEAHARWVELISEHPVAAQEPGDYAEAAYTAFENSDPKLAMTILTTGLHRFPRDANFALRAGWVALLTGNPDRAYRFLMSGRQIGFPRGKQENATALLAIAAMQCGEEEDAAAFFQDLVDLDPDWRDPATIETLDWPDELKSTLRQLSMGGLPPL